MVRYLLWFSLSFAAAMSAGCKSTCEATCDEAQANNCTSITGDCSIFCSSLSKVTMEGSCQSQYDAYEACASQGEVCSITDRCSGQQNALATCTTLYCIGHSSDTDCQTIVSATK